MTSPAVGEWEDGDPEVVEAVDVIGDDLDLQAEPAPPAPEGDETPPPPRYATLDAFVDEFLAEICWVDVTGSAKTWCPEWWRHPAAIVRIEALHRSFEHLRLDPATGMSTWLRDHADYHLGVLTDPNGPFKGCSPSKGHTERERRLPVASTPPGLFALDD